MRKEILLIGLSSANRISICSFCWVTSKDGLALLVDFLLQNGKKPGLIPLEFPAEESAT